MDVCTATGLELNKIETEKIRTPLKNRRHLCIDLSHKVYGTSQPIHYGLEVTGKGYRGELCRLLVREGQSLEGVLWCACVLLFHVDAFHSEFSDVWWCSQATTLFGSSVAPLVCEQNLATCRRSCRRLIDYCMYIYIHDKQVRGFKGGK